MTKIFFNKNILLLFLFSTFLANNCLADASVNNDDAQKEWNKKHFAIGALCVAGVAGGALALAAYKNPDFRQKLPCNGEAVKHGLGTFGWMVGAGVVGSATNAIGYHLVAPYLPLTPKEKSMQEMRQKEIQNKNTANQQHNYVDYLNASAQHIAQLQNYITLNCKEDSPHCQKAKKKLEELEEYHFKLLVNPTQFGIKLEY